MKWQRRVGTFLVHQWHERFFFFLTELDHSPQSLEFLLTRIIAFEYTAEWDNRFLLFCAIHDITATDLTHSLNVPYHRFLHHFVKSSETINKARNQGLIRTAAYVDVCGTNVPTTDHFKVLDWPKSSSRRSSIRCITPWMWNWRKAVPRPTVL